MRIKTESMLTISLLSLTSTTQLALFLGIGLILFGWIEKKDKLVLTGQIALFLLGLFALWILLANVIQVPKSAESAITKEMKTLGFIKGLIALMIPNAISILMVSKKIRFYKLSITVVLSFALFLFFMVFSIQQMPS